MLYNNEIIYFNDNLYVLIRTFKDKENFPINEFKEHYGCDTVLKKENILHFCRLIQEAQIVNEDEQIQLVEKKQKKKAVS